MLVANGNGIPACTEALSATAKVRVVVVVEADGELKHQLSLVRHGLAHPGARPVLESQGVFLREASIAPPRIAFAFAGQGSQYPGMLQTLVRESPAATAIVQRMGATLRSLSLPTFEQLALGA